MNSNDIDIFLSEYENAHNSFHHYDSFRWQSGSILIAAAVVLWGLLFSRDRPPTLDQVGITSAFVSLIMSCWLLYAHHYRQLYLTKLLRIHEIEKQLKMKLNSRLGFLGSDSKIKLLGLKGHKLDVLVYVFVSNFGIAYWLFSRPEDPTKAWYHPLVIVTLLIVLATLCAFFSNEKKIKSSLRALFLESDTETPE